MRVQHVADDQFLAPDLLADIFPSVDSVLSYSEEASDVVFSYFIVSLSVSLLVLSSMKL